MVDVLESDLHLHVAEFSSPWIFLHAGAVGWKGRAIVLPGRSFVGKSTLVAALLRAGATLFSDEYAVLDGAGQVHPYPRRLSLRRPGATPLRCPPEALGSATAVGPAPIALIALLTFDSGRSGELEKLSPGKAVLHLLLNAVPVRRRQHAVIELLSSIASRVPVWHGQRGEADAAAARLLRWSENVGAESFLPSFGA